MIIWEEEDVAAAVCAAEADGWAVASAVAEAEADVALAAAPLGEQGAADAALSQPRELTVEAEA